MNRKKSNYQAFVRPSVRGRLNCTSGRNRPSRGNSRGKTRRRTPLGTVAGPGQTDGLARCRRLCLRHPGCLSLRPPVGGCRYCSSASSPATAGSCGIAARSIRCRRGCLGRRRRRRRLRASNWAHCCHCCCSRSMFFFCSAGVRGGSGGCWLVVGHFFYQI
jgi:hypothetical protein